MARKTTVIWASFPSHEAAEQIRGRGGLIGIVVDSSSGAAMDHTPNPVIARLEPLKNVSPVVRRKLRVVSAAAT